MTTTANARSRALRATMLTTMLVLVACGSDTILAPTFGAGCSQGPLAPGDTVTGGLSPASCVDPLNVWSGNSSPYQSWTVTLGKNKAYMFHLQHTPDADQGGIDDLDPLLILYGSTPDGASVPLGVSDDEADGKNSVLFFIAPRSGTFQLVAHGYQTDGYGGYELAMNECPILGVMDTVGDYSFTLQPSPCVRKDPPGGAASYARYSFVRIAPHPDGYLETLSAKVTTANFTPTWEMFGNGFDAFESLHADSDYGSGLVSGGTASVMTIAGQTTIAIGGQGGPESGQFYLQFGRMAMPPAPHPVPDFADGRSLPMARPVKTH